MAEHLWSEMSECAWQIQEWVMCVSFKVQFTQIKFRGVGGELFCVCLILIQTINSSKINLQISDKHVHWHKNISQPLSSHPLNADTCTGELKECLSTTADTHPAKDPHKLFSTHCQKLRSSWAVTMEWHATTEGTSAQRQCGMVNKNMEREVLWEWQPLAGLCREWVWRESMWPTNKPRPGEKSYIWPRQ